MELRNEFAHVQVTLDTTANGPRLMIEDVKSGAITYLDPLELERLAWMRHADMAPLLDPELGRRRDPEDVMLERMAQQLGRDENN